MIAWLERHIHVQCQLSMGQTPLLVSSDVVESLIGKFKIVLMRNPKAEFNRIMLTLPTLCKQLNSASVDQALFFRRIVSFLIGGSFVYSTPG